MSRTRALPISLLLLIAACVEENEAPGAPKVSIGPTLPATDADLVAVIDSEAKDPEGDEVTYTYAWKQNGLPRTDLTTATVPAAETTKGETWEVSVTPNDGATDGSSATSATTTILNTAPTAPVVEITPEDAEEGDDLTCSVTTASADDDGDAVAYTFSWDVDGAAYTGASDAAMASVVDGADVGGGEVWTCEAVAGDGDDLGGAGSDSVRTTACDGDGDGVDGTVCGGEDCDDTDSTVYPMAGDTYGDGVDGDCDGMDCEGGWSGGVYFVACTEGMTQAAATLACTAAGYAGLASVESAAEDAYVAALLGALPYAGTTLRDIESWIGLSDEGSEGSWKWSNGSSSTHTNWYSGEPAGGRTENCVIVADFTSYTWIDVPCSRSFYAPICANR